MNILRNLSATLLITTVASPAIASLKQYDTNATLNYAVPEHCAYPGDEPEELCQIPIEERTPAFQNTPTIPNSIQLDIRPANCASFFDDYLHTRRGLRIESALASSTIYSEHKSTVSNYPIVDFYSNGLIRIVKTRDLSVDSFNNSVDSDKLYKQILEDATAIKQRFIDVLSTDDHITATSNGITTTLNKQDARMVTLDIIVQTGIADQSHIDQIEKAKSVILEKWGFYLQVIEIP